MKKKLKSYLVQTKNILRWEKKQRNTYIAIGILVGAGIVILIWLISL